MNADAFLAFLTIAALIGLFYGPWQHLCTDFARQLLFEQRDKLFDLGHAGRLAFESPQYRTMRESLERSIRFEHDLTLPRLAYIAWALRISKTEQSDLRSAASSVKDEAVRAELNAIVNRAATITLGAILARSALTLLAIPLLASAAVVALLFDAARLTALVFAKGVGEIAQKEAEFCA